MINFNRFSIIIQNLHDYISHLWKLPFGTPRCLQPWMESHGSCPKCRSAIDAALDVAQKAAFERWEDNQWVLEMMIWLVGSDACGSKVWYPLVPGRYLRIAGYWMFIPPTGIDCDPSAKRLFFFNHTKGMIGWDDFCILLHLFGIDFACETHQAVMEWCKTCWVCPKNPRGLRHQENVTIVWKCSKIGAHADFPIFSAKHYKRVAGWLDMDGYDMHR